MSTKQKPKVVMPSEAEIPALTDRVTAINAELAKLAEEKKGIEARLEAYALAHSEAHEPLKDEKREGRRMIFTGASRSLPIVFSSDLIIGTFPANGPKHKELINILCGENNEHEATAEATLKLFFDAPSKWENRYDNGVKFRAAVAERLGSKIGAKFVSACTQTDKHGVKKSTTSFDYTHGKVVES
ncbi:hypothetical protein [Prosthecobacter sp.]|uniref:hypothetical protein n=1 Tax=Prosthecobacter sp. TaxID=1965333 RepID=UPI0037830B69